LRIVWSIRARLDRHSLTDFLEAESPMAAVHMTDRIDEAMDLLGEFPNAGRPGRVAGTRELVIARTPYIAAYQVQSDRVFILRVLHAAQAWPKAL
jgi:addiction module RelE/StbE family toxin